MEPDRIAEVMALAIEVSGQERLAAADRPVTAAWLLEDLDAIPDDLTPSRPIIPVDRRSALPAAGRCQRRR